MLGRSPVLLTSCSNTTSPQTTRSLESLEETAVLCRQQLRKVTLFTTIITVSASTHFQHGFPVQVLVASIGPSLLIKRMQLCTRLWSAGIKAEFVFQPKPNMDKQLTYALEEGIPLVVSAQMEERGTTA